MKLKRLIFTVALVLGLPAGNFAVNSESALPPVETVLQRVADKSSQEAENDRTFKERYFFTRTRVKEFRNAKGEMKKREEKKGDNDPLKRTPVAKPQAVMATDPETGAVTTDQPVSDTHSNVRGKQFSRSEFVLNDDLLGRFDFTLAGRDVVNGRPALMVDFQPAKRKVPVRNLKDRFINKAAGRVWVDEADYALVKADLYLTERVNVLGGLVGAVRKFTFGFLRERTPDGLWFTRTSNWHLEGREVFVQRTVDYHEERTDLRRVIGNQTSLNTHSVDADDEDE